MLGNINPINSSGSNISNLSIPSNLMSMSPLTSGSNSQLTGLGSDNLALSGDGLNAMIQNQMNSLMSSSGLNLGGAMTTGAAGAAGTNAAKTTGATSSDPSSYIMQMVAKLTQSSEQIYKQLMTMMSQAASSTGTAGATGTGTGTATVNAAEAGKAGTVTVNYKHSGVMPAQKAGNHTWVNKCPFCGGSLLCNPKKTAEGELTCGKCDADFDGNTGYDKTYKPRAKLTEVTS